MSKAENLVIMFTDIVGFTELTSNQSRQQNEAMLHQNEKLLVGVAKSFGGKRIKSIGDALLLVFKSPTDAVHCAMAMHDSLWDYNQTVTEDERLAIRVSLNSGEVRIDGGDVFGEPVNVAARLEGITPANEVYFTEAIYLSMNKAEVSHELVGKHKLKGISERVTVYRVPRGASAQRLVSVGNDEGGEHQFPYGGMHRVERQTSSGVMGRLPIKQIACAALACVVILSVVKFWPQNLLSPDIDRPALTLLLEENNLVALEEKIIAILQEDPNDAQALFMQGHIKFARRSYEDALNLYAVALSQQPALAEDERYASNLLSRLSSNGIKVTELAKLGPSEVVVDKLSARSVSAGISGRRDAAYILRELDRQDKMDSVAMAVLDLQEVKGCEEKKAAIKILADRKDPRGLPALKKIVKGSFASRLKYGCYYKDAKKAIQAIEGVNRA